MNEAQPAEMSYQEMKAVRHGFMFKRQVYPGYGVMSRCVLQRVDGRWMLRLIFDSRGEMWFIEPGKAGGDE